MQKTKRAAILYFICTILFAVVAVLNFANGKTTGAVIALSVCVLDIFITAGHYKNYKKEQASGMIDPEKEDDDE